MKLKASFFQLIYLLAAFPSLAWSSGETSSFLGLNFTHINSLSNHFALSQVFSGKRFDIINNCGIVIVPDKNTVKFYDYFFDGFSVQSIISLRILDYKQIAAGPFVSCLIYGTLGFEKRLCLSTGIQASALKRINISLGICPPIDPHFMVTWSVYKPVLQLSVSAFLYQFKENRWLGRRSE